MFQVDHLRKCLTSLAFWHLPRFKNAPEEQTSRSVEICDLDAAAVTWVVFGASNTDRALIKIHKKDVEEKQGPFGRVTFKIL